ncbi:histidine kinase [Pigmentiphaga sp. H8]|nr:histidine kinase [Pigmentiphaga sp. H8]
MAACAVARAGSATLHITQAQIWSSASTAWTQPSSLDDLDDADAALKTTDASWQTVALPHARKRVLLPRATPAADRAEVVWYRMRIPSAGASGPDMRLYAPRWQATGTLAVYVNGRLAWQSRGDRAWNNFNHPLWIDLDGLLQPGQEAWVYVRMASQQNVGGALSSVWVGPAAGLLPAWRWRSFLQTGLPAYWRGSFLVLGLFALGLAAWLRAHRPRHGDEREASSDPRPFALFFCMALGQAVGGLLFLVNDQGVSMDFAWFSWMTLVAMLIVPVCGFHFLGLVQHRPRPRLGRALVLYWIVAALVTLPSWWTEYPGVVPLQRFAILPPVLAQIYAAAANAWHQRSRTNILVAAWGPLSLLMGWHDMAMQNYLLDVEGIYLTPYVNLGLLTLFLLLAFTHYTHALDLAAHARAMLAERLAEQARELVQTHERLRTAEREQTLLAERQRLMSEMHDGVGSSLMSALRLVELGREPVNIAQVLKECIDDLKIAIDSLESSDADLLTLLGALRFRLGPRLAGAGIALRWQMNDLPLLPWLDAQSALHVLRILQEVLTNIVKHGDATEITMATAEALAPNGTGQRGVQVRVSDNGQPFSPPPPEAQPPGRRGLVNVRNRASVLGAHCDWQTVPRGTTFSLWLPLAKHST